MPAHPKPKPQSLRDAWPSLAGLSAVFLFEMLDNSVLNVALPTIGHQLHASATALQWITSSYAIVFGGCMLAFGALADRVGRRRIMLLGLTLLGIASLLTAFVTNSGELIAVRMLIGLAASMTTPGTISLAFRLFDHDGLRIRAISVITTVGLVGLTAGPIVGGLLLSVLPWQVLLLINVPIAVLAFVGIRSGIAPEADHELHAAPVDGAGAALGSITILLAIAAPTLFVDEGVHSPLPWGAGLLAVITAVMFTLRLRTAPYPLIDTALLGQPLVASGLAYKAATGLAMAGVGYILSLQMQLAWRWTPVQASFGMLPQVVTLLASGFFVEKLVQRIGMRWSSMLGAVGVLSGLIIFGMLGTWMYIGAAIAMVCIAAGLRVVGVVVGVSVMKGMPKTRTSLGSALVDTTSELSSAVSVALCGTTLAMHFKGELAGTLWTVRQTSQFHSAASASLGILTVIVALLIGWAFTRTPAMPLEEA